MSASAAAASTAPRPASSDEIELPLAPVLAGLSMDLRAKLMTTPPPGQTIFLRADFVINQLAFGAVKVTFGELRQLAPGIFVNSGELDNKLVSLPLQEILPRLSPAMLSRRASKHVEVAEEIVGPFAERGRGFAFTTQPLKAAPAPVVPPPAPAPAPAPLPASPIAFTPPAARQIFPASPLTPPAPQVPHIPPRSVTPAAPIAPAPLDYSYSQLSPHAATPPPKSGIGTPGHGAGNGHSLPPQPLRLCTDTPAVPPAPAAPVVPPAPAAPAVSGPTIFAAISDLCESWPESLRAEILRSPLAQANVPLDGGFVLPGLKRGRVVMTWKQIRQLALPSSAPSPHDNLELELPLKVLAPLFLAAQKNLMRSQSRPAVSSEIPELFFGFPQAAPAALTPPAPPAPPAPTPLPPAAAAPAAPLPAAAPFTPVVPPLARPSGQDTNFYVWGENGEAPMTDESGLRTRHVPQTDFMSRQAHPREVVLRAASLPGVAGAVVALADGLRVASQVPSELNADTLAAFLPQIFERVNQSTRELRMGALNNINFTVGNIPWKIFRVSAVYFAAFGRAGEQLPSAQLAQLASELDRKKQP